MSLSSLLVGSSTAVLSGKAPIDKELDALFTTSLPTVVRGPVIPRERKRRLDCGVDDNQRPNMTGTGSKKRVRGNEEEVDQPSDEDDSDVQIGDVPLIHESLEKSGTRKAGRSKVKYTPADETSEQRDARTIFVGNLSIEVAQKKSSLKRLYRHILSVVPSAKIESTRFRSIPFQTPTSKLPTSEDEDSSSKKINNKNQANGSTQTHGRDRASSWRDRQEDNSASDEKKFLTPKEKKKIAFINHDFHSTANAVNAYIVFGHPPPPESRPSNVPPPPHVMDPYEAACLAATKCDGMWFMERMVRVDLVKKVGNLKNTAGSSIDGNPKLNVFVGNLDFASNEEDLRAFFEAAVSSERGHPDHQGDTNTSWVTRVRIIRDKDTQLGKGFAYIQFSDRECVDEVLALDDTKRKFAKRTLRLQRCKTLPGSSPASKVPLPTNSRKRSPSKPAIESAKGDPSLGEKLSHLSKEARKQFKSSDADRVARRLAKKKARMALARDGVKPQVKDRDRVRKSSAVKKGYSAPQKGSKGRVRSEKRLSKQNTKK